MATTEHTGLLTYIDANNNQQILYPVTTTDAVDGLDEEYEQKKLQLNNVSVAASAFISDSTYEDFPFRAALAISGVTNSMIPEVIFNLADATSGMFSPVVESYNGGVYIYAAEQPASTVTIPTILLWKGNVQ